MNKIPTYHLLALDTANRYSKPCHPPAMEAASILLHLSLLHFFATSGLVMAATFTLTNNCAYTVWPGVLSGAGTAPLDTTGFPLQKGEFRQLTIPANWSGRFWGRTLCSTDPSTGKFTCATGDCGSGAVDCSGSGAAPPATLAEFTLAGADGMDFYDVSLVDGYNLPMSVVPQGGSGNCTTTGCAIDLNVACPSDLMVAAAGEGVACRSACEAFKDPRYCCSGEYGSPDTCKPTAYSEFFKSNCPRAYSYAYDDGTSTFTCAGADYFITFCPIVTSKKTSGHPEAADLPDNKMVFMDGKRSASASRLRGGSAMAAVSVLVLGTWAW